MKKVMAVFMVVTIFLSLATPCAAAETTKPDWSGYNVSPVSPMSRGPSYPTEVHYPNSQGQYDFQGKADYSMLWLGKALYGCGGYMVHIENHSGKWLHVIVRGTTKGDMTLDVAPYSDSTTDNNGNKLYYPAYPDQPFCITFDAPSNFSGYVSCGCYFGG